MSSASSAYNSISKQITNKTYYSHTNNVQTVKNIPPRFIGDRLPNLDTDGLGDTTDVCVDCRDEVEGTVEVDATADVEVEDGF